MKKQSVFLLTIKKTAKIYWNEISDVLISLLAALTFIYIIGPIAFYLQLQKMETVNAPLTTEGVKQQEVDFWTNMILTIMNLFAWVFTILLIAGIF